MACSDERAALTPAVMARYWAKINKNGPLWKDSPCWLWTAGTSKAGYGQLRVRVGTRFVALYAHRIALLVADGLPHGREACHNCNRPRCVNPDHLYAGTHRQNMQQARCDGLIRTPRYRVGEAHPFSRLSDAQVRTLREQRAAGVKLIDLAASWDYDFTSISDICRGKTRVSAGGPLTRRFTHHRKAVAS